MKVVINKCYGGFSLSKKAMERLSDLGITTRRCEGERANLLLVQVVEELGDEASGSCADLKIVEIPDGVEFQIEDYDGNEWVAEKHRVWS